MKKGADKQVAKQQSPISFKEIVLHRNVGIPAVIGGITTGAISFCSNIGLFSGITSYVAEQTMLSGLSSALVVAGASSAIIPAAIGLGLCMTAAIGYRYYSARSGSVQNEQSLSKILININTAFNEKAKMIDFNFNNLDDEFVDGLSNTLRNHTSKKGQSTIVPSIILNTKQLTAAYLEKLLNSGLGKLSTTHLEITGTAIENKLLMLLKKAMLRGDFKDLKTLNLSNNQLSIACLRQVSEIASLLNNLETVDLSGNAFNFPDHTQQDFVSPALVDFFKDFTRRFPKLKTLRIADISLTESSLHVLLPLFSKPSLLESIDIQNNDFRAKDLQAFLSRLEVKSNLNVRQIESDFDNRKSISKITEQRRVLRKGIQDALGVSDTRVLSVALLEHLSEKRAENSTLKRFFSEKGSENGEGFRSQGAKWRYTSERIVAFRQQEIAKQTKTKQRKYDFESYFVDFLREAVSDTDYAIHHSLQAIKSAKRGAELELSFNNPDLPFPVTASQVIGPLEAALLAQSSLSNGVTLKKINLNNLKLTVDEFSNLFVNGLGDFQTRELLLSGNQLGNATIYELRNNMEMCFETVKVLDISNNNLTVECLSDLVQFARQVGLEELNISGNMLNPVTEQQRLLLADFCAQLHRTVPTLRRLTMSNIGLTQTTIHLLKPLLRNMSFISDLDIAQETNKRYATFQTLVQDDGFQSNIALVNLNTGRNEFKNIRKNLEKKAQAQTVLQRCFSSQEKKSPVLLVLLNRFFKSNEPTLPAEINALLDNECAMPVTEFSFTNRQKIQAIVRRVKYFRDKASLMNVKYKFPQEIGIEEIQALHSNRLESYWKDKLSTKGAQSVESTEEFVRRHRYSNLSVSNLRAYELFQYESGPHKIKGYIAEDDTVRLINVQTNRQLILPRYAQSFALNSDQVRVQTIGSITIIFDANGDFEIKANNQKIICVSNDFPQMHHPDHHGATKLIPFHRFENAENIGELVQPLVVDSSRPAVTHQFQNARQTAVVNTDSSRPANDSSLLPQERVNTALQIQRGSM